MKINNENEKFIIHFMFSYKYSICQILSIHVMKNIKVTYHLVKRQETSYMIIHQEQYI